jgi:arylsulfatase
VHWAKGIEARGEVRTQYAHAIDMVPTVLEALGLESPQSIRGVSQSAIEGFSLAQTFNEAAASGQHTTQYFEMLGHRSIYHDGWRAVCPWPGTSFTESGRTFGTPITAEMLTQLDATGWELYHVEKDWAENHNVAAENRPKLIEMIAQWYVEAGKYNVLPVDGRGQQRFAEERPQLAANRTSYTYYPGTQEVPVNAAARLLNRPHSITADVELKPGDEGVLLSQGGIDGGFSFFIKDGRLRYTYNYVARTLYQVESNVMMPEDGRHQLRFEFEVTGQPDILKGKGTPGRGQLYMDGKLEGQVEMPVTTPLAFSLAGGIAVGADPGAPVTPEYQPPFAFTGKLYSITIDVSGELIQEDEAEMRAIMARQ